MSKSCLTTSACQNDLQKTNEKIKLKDAPPQQNVEIQQHQQHSSSSIFQQQQFESSSFQQQSVTSSTTTQQVLNGSFEVSPV